MKKAAAWFQELRVRTWALYYACRDPETPWYAKAWAGLVVAYAFSPLDIIPDFIPVLGLLDDAILIPLGIALALRMIPRPIMENAMKRARTRVGAQKPVNWVAGAAVLLVWAVVLFFVGRWIVRLLRPGR
jgi:uncharacterized membrane protein YkvA (DUF1232 family)